MLSSVVATRFIQQMGNGRTKPCLIECEDDDGNVHEVVVKYSSSMFEKVKNLALEAIVSMLAADLGLPVPEPFVVDLDPMFLNGLTNGALRKGLESSCRQAFGSRHQKGYAAWLTGQTVPKEMSQSAAEIAVFDLIVKNADRGPITPNCMFLGDELLIFDHELTFQLMLGWVAPWAEGGLSNLAKKDYHIFAGPYFASAPTELERFAAAWEAMPDERFQAYRDALPPSWVYDEDHIAGILDYLREAKSQIRTITAGALKVLT